MTISENEFKSDKHIFITTGNIEILLESLDGIKRAEAPPFLYGKIRAKLDVPQKSILDKLDHLFTRPVIAVSILFIVILMDGIVIQSNLKQETDTNENTVSGSYTEDDYNEIMGYYMPFNEYAYNN